MINNAIRLGAPKTIAYGDAVQYVNEKFGRLGPAQDKAAQSAEAWLKTLGDTARKALDAAQADADLTDGLAALGIVRGDVTDGEKLFADQLKASEEAAKKAMEAAKKHAEELQRQREHIENVRIATVGYRDGGVGWKQTIIGIRDAFIATGRSEAEAEAAAKKLWDSSRQGGATAKAAIEEINAVFAEQKKRIGDANTELGGLLKSGLDLGIKLPESFKGPIQSLIDMGTITRDNADLFASLTGKTEVDFKKMQGTAQKYGIDLAALGPQFESARLHDTAKGIINAFDELTLNGADVNGVLGGMKDVIDRFTIPDAASIGIAKQSQLRCRLRRRGQARTTISART